MDNLEKEGKGQWQNQKLTPQTSDSKLIKAIIVILLPNIVKRFTHVQEATKYSARSFKHVLVINWFNNYKRRLVTTYTNVNFVGGFLVCKILVVPGESTKIYLCLMKRKIETRCPILEIQPFLKRKFSHLKFAL